MLFNDRTQAENTLYEERVREMQNAPEFIKIVNSVQLKAVPGKSSANIRNRKLLKALIEFEQGEHY